MRNENGFGEKEDDVMQNISDVFPIPLAELT